MNKHRRKDSKNNYKHIILMYHEVTNIPEREKQIRKIDPAYSLPSHQFEEQMVYLQNSKYAVISLDEGCDNPLTSLKSVIITFDDGLIGNYEHAFPILQKYNFTAAFFVVVDRITKSRYMNWKQLRELHQDGHLIQSHTMTHPMLGECNEKQIYYELDKSKKIIENKIGNVVKYLSLPFGSSNMKVIRIAKEVGYSAVFTSRLNELQISKSPYYFGRIPVKDSYGLDVFNGLLSGRSKFYYKILFFDYIKNKLKRLIGLNNYRRIYRTVNKIKLEK
jgi:peptidoglycan/xylan/chitin deacetylase (PgdA/CDA1 family)